MISQQWQRREAVGSARELLCGLRDLGRVRAPSSILPSVLDRVGVGDAYAPIETPIGPVFVAFNGGGIAALVRAPTASAFEQAFRARFGRPVRRVAALPAALARRLGRVLRRGAGRASLRFDLRGLSPFEAAVLRKALEIPRGEVRTYAWVAREIGRPAAVRAVGSALGRNPVPLLIPCHRVVRSDGHIGDYVFGGEAKRAILTHEGVEPEGLERLARTGVRYVGSATTRIYCFPTCRHARRITERHRIPFGSEARARAAGYRPCRVCRPLSRSA